MRFVVFVFCVMLISAFNQSCTKTPLFKEETDLVKDSLRGNISFVITKYFIRRKNNSFSKLTECITKYNKDGNTIRKKEFNILYINDVEYTYDNVGNIIVQTKSIHDLFNSPLKTEIFKYRYDNNGYINTIEKYEQSSNTLQVKTEINRDEFGYPIEKIVENIYLSNILNNLGSTDTNKVVTTTIYCYSKDYVINKILVNEKDYQRITEYKYNDKGLYSQIEDKEYTKGEITKDFNTLLSYNNYNDLILCTSIDSIKNTQYDYYYTYEYDDKNNWIRKNFYDNFHNLIEYTTRVIEYFPEDKSTKSIDYSWESKQSPLERKFYYDRVREQKCRQYLNDDFVLEQFREKMKREYSQYKIIGEPQITYKMDSVYNINFDAKESDVWGGGYYPKENYTVQIIINIDSETFNFVPIKGNLY